MTLRARMFAVATLVGVALSVGCRADPTSPSSSPIERWAAVTVDVPADPSSAMRIGPGVHGPLLGGGSVNGPWLDRIEGVSSQAVARDLMAAERRSATVAGIASFRSHSFALVGPSLDEVAPLELIASADDINWRNVTPPAWHDVTVNRAVDLIATDGLLVALMVVDGGGDQPTARLLVWESPDGQVWSEVRDPAFTLAGHPRVAAVSAGPDLLILAGPASPVLSGDPPVLLVGSDGLRRWHANELADLKGSKVTDVTANDDTLWISGCGTGDPSTAVVWKFSVSTLTAPESIKLGKADSCVSAITTTDGGFVAVGSQGLEPRGWRWQESSRTVTEIAFPPSSPAGALAVSIASVSRIVAAGSTPATTLGDLQQAKAWLLDGAVDPQ